MSGNAGFNRGESRQDFETPHDFIEAVAARFGRPVWDLAATNENRQAPYWFDIATDSLKQDWHRNDGLMWLNPPFSNIAPWAEKCAAEGVKGAKILFLVPASVGSNWFAQHVFEKCCVLFLNKRLTFVGAKDAYPKDCMLCCYNCGLPDLFEVWRWK